MGILRTWWFEFGLKVCGGGRLGQAVTRRSSDSTASPIAGTLADVLPIAQSQKSLMSPLRTSWNAPYARIASHDVLVIHCTMPGLKPFTLH